MRLSRRHAVVFLAVFGLTVGLDQASKVWARGLPAEPTHHKAAGAKCSLDDLARQTYRGVAQPVIAGYWEWELAMNDGAAFSNFRGKQVVLSVIAFGALVLLGAMVLRTKPQEGLKRTALALIAGGALGNLVDRVLEGAVVDFVRWRFGEHRWPIFNVADVALVVGVVLLLVEGWLAKRKVTQAAPAAA
jgi:signal peptidase II